MQDELARMESLGVISCVEEPTPWCTGMVVVPKKSGAVHIFADFRPLKVHSLPKVDETLVQMAGATVFSKLNANCEFWQISPDEQSRSLSTFIALFVRYCFNKLPFGILSAPEHFQRRMNWWGRKVFFAIWMTSSSLIRTMMLVFMQPWEKSRKPVQR